MQAKVQLLRVHATGIDPQTITNWNMVQNVVAVWADTAKCRQNARYFYDEMENDPEFNGAAWYSSRSFVGEKLQIATIDEKGKVGAAEYLRVQAVAMTLDGFVPRKQSPYVDRYGTLPR